MTNYLNEVSSKLLGRNESIFSEDFLENFHSIHLAVKNKNLLVIGGAGSIGQATVKVLLEFEPNQIDVVDINENDLTELVRDCRSSFLNLNSKLNIFCISASSLEFLKLTKQRPKYDFIFNLAALKHVRSEANVFTLARMIETNVLIGYNCSKLLSQNPELKYFCVSTDKAADPINLMGASKKLMELSLFDFPRTETLSSARFANVLFSNGSLTASFDKRLASRQPLVCPKNIFRYFVSSREAGQLCVMAGVLGKSREIFFPKTNSHFELTEMKALLSRYLSLSNLKPKYFQTENQVILAMEKENLSETWPVLLTEPDTDGEKSEEIFFTSGEKCNFDSFKSIGIIEGSDQTNLFSFDEFYLAFNEFKEREHWEKDDLIEIIKKFVPMFRHHSTGKDLNLRM